MMWNPSVNAIWLRAGVSWDDAASVIGSVNIERSTDVAVSLCGYSADHPVGPHGAEHRAR